MDPGFVTDIAVMMLAVRPAAGGGDTTPPDFHATNPRVVNGSTLTITYNEPLDTTKVPATSAFAVTVAGSARAVSAVSVDNLGAGGVGRVVLTLASPVTAGQEVTVSYTP